MRDDMGMQTRQVIEITTVTKRATELFRRLQLLVTICSAWRSARAHSSSLSDVGVSMSSLQTGKQTETPGTLITNNSTSKRIKKSVRFKFVCSQSLLRSKLSAADMMSCSVNKATSKTHDTVNHGSNQTFVC